MKKKVTIKCGKCRKTGHNMRTCGKYQKPRKELLNRTFTTNNGIEMNRIVSLPKNKETLIRVVNTPSSLLKQPLNKYEGNNPAYPKYYSLQAADVSWDVIDPDIPENLRSIVVNKASQPVTYTPIRRLGEGSQTSQSTDERSIKNDLSGYYGVLEEIKTIMLKKSSEKNIYYFNPEGFLHKLDGPAVNFIYKDGINGEEFWAGGKKTLQQKLCREIQNNKVTFTDLKDLTTHKDIVARNLAAYSLLTRVPHLIDEVQLYAMLTQPYASQQLQDMIMAHEKALPEWEVVIEIMKN